ncbi:MAG: HAD family hydrolase [Cardiobacteriaceae bacterium]|nr:HAD family hydrolase [Cardiobacteriaceae bacterium]
MKGDFLFLDIDGCLSRGKFAPFDVKALQNLADIVQASETEVVLCTGRSLSYIEAIAQFVRFGRYAVTDHGALLFDYLEDEVTYAPQMTKHIREKIVALSQYLESQGNALAVHWKMSHGKEACVSLVAEKGKYAADVRAVIETNLQLDGFDLHCSGRALDIVPHGVSKWTGAQFFLQHFGKTANRLAAIGDSPGDLPILTQVDFAACPANAENSVKTVCHYVSAEAEVYGVTDIFRRFFA